MLFTAAIVSNIESVQQTLDITLDSAYTHVFISVEVLIWVRSFVVVLLLVAHALRHVQTGEQQQQQQKLVLPAITPGFINELRVLLAPNSVSEEHVFSHDFSVRKTFGKSNSLRSEMLGKADTQQKDAMRAELREIFSRLEGPAGT